MMTELFENRSPLNLPLASTSLVSCLQSFSKSKFRANGWFGIFEQTFNLKVRLLRQQKLECSKGSLWRDLDRLVPTLKRKEDLILQIYPLADLPRHHLLFSAPIDASTTLVLCPAERFIKGRFQLATHPSGRPARAGITTQPASRPLLLLLV